jgi:hypothetical protein
MVKRKWVEPDHEHTVDRISRRLDNYWTMGVNVRFVLGTGVITDALLALILEYALDSRCFVALYYPYRSEEATVLGVGVSYRAAQKIMIREMINKHFDQNYPGETDEIDKLRTLIRDKNINLEYPKSLDDLSDDEMSIFCKSFDREDEWYCIEESTLF